MKKENKKQVIGLLGEMNLSMELHERGWQVHKSYIDEGIDFIITKYYCTRCRKFTEQLIKTTLDQSGNILNKGKKHNYDCFKDFHNNFGCLEEILESDVYLNLAIL